MTSKGRYLKEYNDTDTRTPSDPWTDLANAVVAQAADDYRRLCHRLIKSGVKMSEIELNILNAKLNEIECFFQSEWGFLLSHGLAPTILEKLRAEVDDDICEMYTKRERWMACSGSKEVHDKVCDILRGGEDK